MMRIIKPNSSKDRGMDRTCLTGVKCILKELRKRQESLLATLTQEEWNFI
jgi:hypothetical protein